MLQCFLFLSAAVSFRCTVKYSMIIHTDLQLQCSSYWFKINKFLLPYQMILTIFISLNFFSVCKFSFKPNFWIKASLENKRTNQKGKLLVDSVLSYFNEEQNTSMKWSILVANYANNLPRDAADRCQSVLQNVVYVTFYRRLSFGTFQSG